MYFIKTTVRNIDRTKWKAYIIITDIYTFADVKKCMYKFRGAGYYEGGKAWKRFCKYRDSR